MKCTDITRVKVINKMGPQGFTDFGLDDSDRSTAGSVFQALVIY